MSDSLQFLGIWTENTGRKGRHSLMESSAEELAFAPPPPRLELLIYLKGNRGEQGHCIHKPAGEIVDDISVTMGAST